jgi:hypothetical protein
MAMCPTLTAAKIAGGSSNPISDCRMQGCEWWCPSMENPPGFCAVTAIALSKMGVL